MKLRLSLIAASLAMVLGAVIALRSAGWFETGERAKMAFSLQDMYGKSVNLADFAGKPVILNFWATWCPPCRLETPDLVALHAKYQDRGLVILGISIDDTPDLMIPFGQEFKITYPLLVGLDRQDVLEAFGIGAGIPTSVFIKASGRILGRLEGIATRDWWETQIKQLF